MLQIVGDVCLPVVAELFLAKVYLYFSSSRTSSLSVLFFGYTQQDGTHSKFTVIYIVYSLTHTGLFASLSSDMAHSRSIRSSISSRNASAF